MPRIPTCTDFTSESEVEVSRRHVLRGGATGFALAASGVLIPEVVHGDAHHRRKHRHHPGPAGRKDMEFVFIAGSSAHTQTIQVWSIGISLSLWSPLHTVRAGQQETFSGSMTELILENRAPGIDSKPVYFRGSNPIIGRPTMLIAEGTWGKDGLVDRGRTYTDQSMFEEEVVVVGGFQVKRVKDSPNYKVFFITALD